MKKIYLIQVGVSISGVLDNRIKSLGTWIKYFDNNWIIESKLSSKEIYTLLSNGYENDNIFIIELSKTNYWGRMNTKVWEYFKERK